MDHVLYKIVLNEFVDDYVLSLAQKTKWRESKNKVGLVRFFFIIYIMIL